MKSLFKLFVIICLIGLFLTAGPWCIIWAINTLVHAGRVSSFTIPFDFWTWLAALLLGGLSVIPAVRRS